MGQRAAWSTVVEVLQLFSSVLVFILLARLMTKEEYGTMTAVFGALAPVVGLSTFGSHVLLLRRTAQGEELGAVFKRVTSTVILGPAVFSALMILLQPLILPSVDPWIYGMLMVGQLNLYLAAEFTVFLGNATRRMKEAAHIRAILVACRFVALGWFAFFTERTLFEWVLLSLIFFGLAAVLAYLYVWRVFGIVPSIRHGSLSDAREGLPYSVSSVTESFVDMSDRPLLERYGHTEDVAIYGVGARIVAFGYLPIRVLLRSSDADIFEAAERGMRSTWAATRKLMVPGLLIGLGTGVGLWITAPLVELLAGSGYEEAIATIRLLAVLPAIRAVQYLIGNCLSAARRQPWRLGATAAAAAVNFGLNLVYLVNGSWRTAVYTTFVSEIFLTVVMLIIVMWLSHVEKPGPAIDTRDRSPSPDVDLDDAGLQSTLQGREP